MTHLTDKQIEELERLMTPGPWHFEMHDLCEPDAPNGWRVFAECDQSIEATLCELWSGEHNNEVHARLIAALPALLSEVKKARSQRAAIGHVERTAIGHVERMRSWAEGLIRQLPQDASDTRIAETLMEAAKAIRSLSSAPPPPQEGKETCGAGAAAFDDIEKASMRLALKKCGEQFRFYEKTHREKSPPQNDKADTNAAMAVMCEFLTSSRQEK